jgi:cyclic beta-1,2-glucan synthetase
VFGIAWAFVAHTDSHFDADLLCRFVRAYQEVQPLTIGELWAVAITLRIVLVENLRRLAELIIRSSAARQEANSVADRLLGAGEHAAEPAAVVLARYDGAALPDAFAVQLVHRLRDQDPRITPALTWLDQHLAARGSTADTIVHDEHQRQGAGVVTVRNIITSMRVISDIDWPELFERISLVDDTLCTGSAFHAMDLPTRNLYRSAIEELSCGANCSELDVARAAVQVANQAKCSATNVEQERQTDPGYHLLAGGRPAFEAAIGFRPSPRAWPGRLSRRLGIGGHVGAGGIVAAVLLAIPLLTLHAWGLGAAWLSVLGLLGAVPAVDTAVAMVNRAITRGFGATPLPALALRDGLPPHLRTLVAMPTLLTASAAIEEQIGQLEVHHLASLDGELHFALVSDWLDAPTQSVDGDEALLETAAAGIARLNRQYGLAPGGPRFLLLHRRRVWNAGEARWIGWERKRGKLHELNRLLRGATDTSFVPIDGQPPTVPADVRFVITLDADTRLPRDAAHRLVGKMAHPLNRPYFDPAAGRVVTGHAVLQPRVTPSLPVGREGSLFQRVFSSMNGIDPYAAAISDVYQDLLGEGSYAGKGIYEIDAFEAALAGRVPDSTLLSHDLFEGIFARAGLASDVEVVEEFPARYDVAARRHHRWARGDWQLLPWLLGSTSPAGTDRLRNAVPALGRWKMVDNLRRTLSAPTCVLSLLAGLALPIAAAAVWIGFVLLTILLPTLIPVVAAVVPRRAGTTLRSHIAAFANDLRLALTQWALAITFLGHQAWLMGDAITRTLLRLFVTHRHLLEWLPAAQATIGHRLDVVGFYRMMAGGVAVGVVGLLVSLLSGHDTWLLAVPLAGLWIASPAIARWVSRSPQTAGRMSLSSADGHMLRIAARRTWRFFETFVTAAEHMLPPDNFQEDPAPALAHRTSPTNMGLYLLSVAAARDFAWLGTDEAADRLQMTLATMGSLARFRGHFYNWYDTSDLRPLDPLYISAVDSGNLAGHLITLANACREWTTLAPTAARRLTGIADALDLAREATDRLRDGRRTLTVTWSQLDASLTALAVNVRQAEPEIARHLAEISAQADVAVDIATAFVTERGDDTAVDMLFWMTAARRTIESHRRDVGLAPEAETALTQRLAVLESTARTMALDMGFGFLIDPARKLLSIGCRVADGMLDSSCYDLLASEARLASLIAIAKGDVPARHWFHLGRAVTPIGSGAALISWSGSMFEYLMPSLIMRAPAGSLLEQTSRLIVRRQIAYGKSLDLPWGVSESAYNIRDLELTYQYSNFGVPGLGLKRGLGESAVVAPYATALASMVDPTAAVGNLATLAKAGACGRYGFYEALDYTPSRLPENARVAIVRAFMAHHQGMTIVAIADTLLDGVMRNRFHTEPMIQATELLLQEATPRDVAVVRPWEADGKSVARVLQKAPSGGRRLATAHGAAVVPPTCCRTAAMRRC